MNKWMVFIKDRGSVFWCTLELVTHTNIPWNTQYLQKHHFQLLPLDNGSQFMKEKLL